MIGKGERRGAPLPCRGAQSLCLKNDENVIYPDFASRKSKNPNEIKVKEAEKAK